jgi:hypothetical protein
MFYYRQTIGVIAVLALALACSGCVLLAAGAGVGAGVGAAQYVRGELSQAYAAPMEKTWEATLAAVDELKMKPTEKSIDNMDQNRWVKGKTEANRDFEIQLVALAKDVTTVKIRIGTFGDEAYSRKAQEAIGKNLKR